MAIVRTFRDLIAWQRSMELARAIYRETQAMPTTEQYGLTIQMRRAAISIPSNIAEGHGRQSRADFLKYLRISRGSLMELDTQLELATTMSLIPTSDATLALLRETDRILQALIRSLEQKQRET
jgi:four helix bundle protein